MKNEIIKFLKTEFNFKVQEWVNLWEEYNSPSSTHETYLKLTYTEEIIKTAVKYKFPEVNDTNERVNNYLTYLESQI